MEANLEKIKALLNSEDSDQRRQGIMLAAKHQAVELVDLLTRLAGEDSDQQLRALARKALDHLAQSRPVKNDADDEKYANQHFEQLLQSEDPYARFAGLKKALQQKSDIARLCILGALEKESLAQLKASMIMAAGRFARSEDVELISEFLRDSDSRVRANAVEALALIGGEAANHYIIAMMGDEDNRVKTNVVKALKGLGGPNLFELLRRMAQDKRVWMRASAVFAFSRIKSPQSLVMLAQLASSDGEEQIRKKALAVIEAEKEDGNPAAARILEKLNKVVPGETEKAGEEIEQELGPVEEDEILLALRHQDPCKRYLALSEINDDFDRFAGDFVAAFQEENDPFLLAMMLTTIKEKKPARSINRCIQLLKHEDDRVRANAVEAATAVEVASSAEYILPLLQDKNSRVAANAVMALGPIGRVDTFHEIEKLLAKGRESFRQSALYVVSLQRESQYVPLLEKLLNDSSPKVRDKTYDILRAYVNDRVPGALKLLQDVEQRISLEKRREHFFENSLDQMFSSLVQMIKSSDLENDSEFVFERTPEAEKQALIQLARKSLQNKPADERTARILAEIETELENISSLIASYQPGPKTNVEEATRKMSEIQLLQIEERTLKIRRDAILVAYAMDIYSTKAKLDTRTQALLRVELARVEGSLCTHVPAGTFSILPPMDAPVSEIFDLTMRLYQKHVWVFSWRTGKQFFIWFLWFMLFAIFFKGFADAPKWLDMARFSKPLAGLYLLLALPVFAYKSLAMFVEWKTLVTCMVDDFVHGREDKTQDWDGRVNALYPKVFSNALRKYFYLLAWFIVAMLIGGTVIASAEAYDNIAFIVPLANLIGVLMMFFIVASVYFKYTLIEPLSVIDQDVDAFVAADKVFSQNKIKVATLIIFSTFIMALITGASMQAMLLLVPVLPGNASQIISSLLAIVSDVCLFPIVYSSLVIYSLMHYRKS